MTIWDVYAQRKGGGEAVPVGSVFAPDADLAMLLARQAYFRHGEATSGWIAPRDDPARRIPLPEPLGGVTDKSYRHADGYVAIGAKAKRVREDLQARGLLAEGSGR